MYSARHPVRSYKEQDLGNGRRVKKFSDCGCVAEYSRATMSFTLAQPWWIDDPEARRLVFEKYQGAPSIGKNKHLQ